jgi:hypothetical protein
MSQEKLIEAVKLYKRLLFPVFLALAEREMSDDPFPDDTILFSFVGSGISDHTTVGMFNEAMRTAIQALDEVENAN